MRPPIDTTGDLFAEPPEPPKKKVDPPLPDFGNFTPDTRHDDIHTSQEAADAISAGWPERLRKIYLYVRSCRNRGTTTLEMAQSTGMVHNNISSAFSQLEKAGYIHHHRDPAKPGKLLTRMNPVTRKNSVLWFIEPESTQ
jgi:hypothetical protein